MVSFGDLSTPAGLSALNSHLATRSYIEGLIKWMHCKIFHVLLCACKIFIFNLHFCAELLWDLIIVAKERPNVFSLRCSSYQPSQADSSLLCSIHAQIDCTKYPHAARWLKHIESFSPCQRKNWGGKPSTITAKAEAKHAKKTADDDDDDFITNLSDDDDEG